VPISQLPAIFWQQAISAPVMAAERKHASTGALAHKNAIKSKMERRIVKTQMLQFFGARVTDVL
jgi:hypothetical protein